MGRTELEKLIERQYNIIELLKLFSEDKKYNNNNFFDLNEPLNRGEMHFSLSKDFVPAQAYLEIKNMSDLNLRFNNIDESKDEVIYNFRILKDELIISTSFEIKK